MYKIFVLHSNVIIRQTHSPTKMTSAYKTGSAFKIILRVNDSAVANEAEVIEHCVSYLHDIFRPKAIKECVGTFETAREFVLCCGPIPELRNEETAAYGYLFLGDCNVTPTDVVNEISKHLSDRMLLSTQTLFNVKWTVGAMEMQVDNIGGFHFRVPQRSLRLHFNYISKVDKTFKPTCTIEESEQSLDPSNDNVQVFAPNTFDC